MKIRSRDQASSYNFAIEDVLESLSELEAEVLLEIISTLVWEYQDVDFISQLILLLEDFVAGDCDNENVPAIATYLRSELNAEDRLTLKSLL